MTTKKLAASIPLLFALAITGCDNQPVSSSPASVASQTISIEHEQGTTEVPVNPKKAIVFNTATLDTMDALGIEIAGLPKTSVHLPSFLAKYEGEAYMNAGTLFEPDYEALSNLQPDLIIAGGRTVDAYAKLTEIAPTVSLIVDTKNFVDSLALRTEQLGKIFNKEEQAKQAISDFKQKIATVKQKSSEKAGSAMVIMINGGKMAAYGPGSRFGFIFDELGFKPATSFPETGRHGNVVNAEMLLNVNPDWVFVLDRDSAIGNKDAQSAKQVLDNPLMRKSSAWNNDKIVYLDSSALYIAGGLQTYSRLLDQIDQVLTAH